MTSNLVTNAASESSGDLAQSGSFGLGYAFESAALAAQSVVKG